MTSRSRRTWLALGLGLVVVLVVLGRTSAAGAEPDPDGDPAATFPWADQNRKEAFRLCLEMVDYVARGRNGDPPASVLLWPGQDPPTGIGRDFWKRVVDTRFFDQPHQILTPEHYTFRPRCDLLLPGDYETLIPARYHSEAYERCLAMLGNPEVRRHEVRRPDLVPAWYWEVSDRIDDCYLLLPPGAFAVGDDNVPWSTWTASQERSVPGRHQNPPVNEAYSLCQEYIEWRVDTGRARAPFGNPLGGKYDRPPPQGVPQRVWQEALDFFVNREDGAMTLPANWRPKCELILTYSGCQPTGPGNRAVLPELCVGPHPTGNYDIGYAVWNNEDEEPDGFPDPGRALWGGTTYFAFHLGKGGVQVALWAVDWAYNFDVTKYDPIAITVGDAYQNRLLSHPQLGRLFWLLLVGWAGFMALTGRVAAAGSEFLITILLLLLAGALMENRQMYMDATWTLMTESETTLLLAGLGHDPSSGDEASRAGLIRDVQQQVHRAFVEEPYDYLNWGSALGRADDNNNRLRRCAAARYFILQGGPWGTDRQPRRDMWDAGTECHDLVKYNRDPTGERLLGAILVMLSSLTVAVLLVVVALTVVVGKIIAVLLFAVAPFAALLAILPAHGRRLTWSWITTLMQVVVAVIGMSFLLSLLLLTLQKLIGLTGDVDLIERFALMNIVVMIVFAARRNLLRSGQLFAARLSEFLASTRGTGVTWASAAASASPGLNLLNIDRTAFYGAVYGAGAPLGAAGRSVVVRMQERRVARRSYKNLQKVARWKRTQNWQKARRDEPRRRADPDGTPNYWNQPLS